MSDHPIALSASFEALEPVLRRAAAELDDLAAQRRRAIVDLAEIWRGGHRDRFDDAHARLEAGVRDRLDELRSILLLVRRGLDEAAAGRWAP